MCQISTLPFGGDGLSFGYVSKWENAYSQVVLFRAWKLGESSRMNAPIVISSPMSEVPEWNMVYGMVPSKVQVDSNGYIPTSKLLYELKTIVDYPYRGYTEDGNASVQTGLYRIPTGSVPPNLPRDNGILLSITTGTNGTIGIQICSSFDGNQIYIRVVWYGTWYAWKKINLTSI